MKNPLRALFIGVLALSLSFGLEYLAPVSQQNAEAKTKKGKKKKRKKRRRARKTNRYGWLFASNKNFPTSASSYKALRKKAAKLSQKKISWMGGSSLEFNFLLIFKRKFRRGVLALKLYRAKDGKFIDVVEFGKPQKFLLSNATFSSSIFKEGVRYELRAVVGRKRRKKIYETTISNTFFTLKK